METGPLSPQPRWASKPSLVQMLWPAEPRESPKGWAGPRSRLAPGALPSPGLFLLQNKARVDT